MKQLAAKKITRAKRVKKDTGDDLEAVLNEPIDQNSEDSDKDFNEKMFFHSFGKYYTFEYSAKGTKYTKVLSNFLMKSLFHFTDGGNNTKRLIKLQHHSGKTHNIEVYSSEASPEKFETILKSHQCSFFGSGYNLKLIFAHLMDSEREAIYLHTLGYNSEHDVFVFSDGILKNNEFTKVNSMGIVRDDSKLFYLPAWSESNIKDKSFETERTFVMKKGDLNFKEYCALMNKAYGLNAMIGISFLINSLFRDIVIKETSFFPYLFLFGQAGTGKSTFIELLTRVFGERDPGTPIKGSSAKGISRKMSQKTNCIAFLKEYTNEISADLLNFFKNAYDGVAYTIAQSTTDNKTATFFIDSGIVIDGNYLPTAENALFDRNILLNFQENKFTTAEGEAHRLLIDHAEKGLGQILIAILEHRALFLRDYKKVYRETLEGLKLTNHDGINLNTLPERNLKHIAFILTPFKILEKVLDFSLEKPELAALKDKVIFDAIDKNQLLNDTKDINIFWDALNWEIDKIPTRVKENKTYQIRTDEKILYLKIQDLYMIYYEYCAKTGLRSVDKSTLIKLLASQDYFIKSSQKGRVNDYLKKDFGNCYRFRYTYNSFSGDMQIGDKELKFILEPEPSPI